MALAVLLLGACGTTAGTGSQSDQTAASQSGQAAEIVSPPPPTTPPTTIASTIPLSKKPPADITVALVRPSTAQWDFYGTTFEQAAAALGWHVNTYLFTTDQPGAVQQAINAHVDYIMGASLLLESLTTQLQEAREANIPFLMLGGNAASDPSKDYYEIYGKGDAYTTQLADWITNDSGGTAKVVYVATLAYPYFQTQTNVIGDHFKQVCPNCTYDTLDITPDALAGGQTPGILASYLQTHPDVNYVYFGYAPLTPGVTPALKGAGILDHVKLTGIGATGPELKEIINGDMSGWVAIPSDTYGWGSLDILARLAVGDDPMPTIEQNDAAGHAAKTWVIDSPEQAEKFVDAPFGWPGPDGFQDQYKALWQLQ